MKKFIVMGMLCLLGMDAFAQKIRVNFSETNHESDVISAHVKEKIEAYAREISEIVKEEKIKMNQEISEVNTQLEANSISVSEAETKKAEIAEKFAEKINNRIDALEFDLDEITKKQVEYTILNTDTWQLIKEKECEVSDKVYRGRNDIVGYLSYGAMYFEDGDDESLNKHLGYSSGIDFGLLYHKQLHRLSPFEFISGVYFSWRTLRFDDDHFIDRAEDGTVSLVQYDKNLEKSKLRSTYVVVPVGFRYNFSPLKTLTGDITYRNVNKGIGIGLNLYGGFLISKNNIVKGDEINYREKGTNYNLSPFVYGAQFTLSIDDVNFYVRQDLSSYFKDNTFDDRKMLQFGVSLGF